MTSVLDAELRANPEYEVVELSRLTAAEREAFGQLEGDPDCFGILRPKPGSGLTMKSICRETALLVFALREPGGLPSYLRSELGRNGDAGSTQITELLFDGVLEMASGSGFVSGARAHGLLRQPPSAPDNEGRLAKLSLEAVRFAHLLPIQDPLRLSAQMYFYNREPVTPSWKRRIHDRASHAEFLGIGRGGPCFETLERHWDESPSFGWRAWSSKRKQSRRTRPAFKLYFSPTLESIPGSLPTVLRAFAEHGVAHFKIGDDLPGLTRPDKIVAYFDSFEDVQRVGCLIAESVTDARVQGVPFTADLLGDGLLSWGMDPQGQGPALEWLQGESWRLWITNRLAVTLLLARSSPALEADPWRFALDRLRLEGVDSETWTPTTAYEQRHQPVAAGAPR